MEKQITLTQSHLVLLHWFIITLLIRSTVTSFLNGEFTLSALDRLQAVSGIPIYKELVPKLSKIALTLHLDTSTPGEPRHMFEQWISGRSALPPTWPTLLGVLLDIHYPLGNKIEDFFNRITPETPVNT